MLALLVALVCAITAALSSTRGVIDERYGPAGTSWTALEMGWGDTIPTRTSNALGHETVSVLDAQGRVQDETDPNGVLSRTTRDGFGRPVASWKQGVGGTLLQTREWVWHEDVVPAWVETTELVHADPLVSGYATATAYEVMDGFGAVVQSWQPDETDSAWVVTESERDVGGHLVSTTKPHRETVFDATYSEKGAPLGRNWVDALGEVRYSLEDEQYSIGEVISYVTAPGVRDVVDADGWVKRTTTDVHGRTVSIEAGRGAIPLELEGSYVWDGRGRLTRFADGNGGEWRYHQDGAGRLRETTRVASGGVETPYLSIEYLGAMPIKQWDETVSPAKEVARFAWDGAGRETQHQLFDDLSGSWNTWSTTWDTLWKGAKTSEVDPAGTVTWAYTPGAFGGFGQPSSAERTFTGFATTPEFKWTYDFAGREISKTWPSGEVVTQTWSASGKALTSSVSAGPTVTYTYDQWGLPGGFQTGGVVQSTVGRVTPGRVSGISFGYIHPAAGPSLYTLGLGYHDNGLLHTKTIPLVQPFFYEYDAHQRITELRQSGNNIQEKYEYDAIGNLVMSWQKVVGGDPWVHDAATRFSEVPHRRHEKAGATTHDNPQVEIKVTD